MRKLASIQSVKEVKNIEGKDRIGLVSFHDIGWEVIMAKEDVKPNDCVVYFEPNSILPELPVFEFLRKRCFSNKYNGYKIHAMKMGGVYSFGLAIPIKEFKDQDFYDKLIKLGVEDDCTELIGVLHKDDERFDKSVHVRNVPKPKGRFKRFVWTIKKFFGFQTSHTSYGRRPSMIRMTDETRVENFNSIWNDNFQDRNIRMYVTMKMDGQSASYALIKDEFWVTSRNVTLYRDKAKKAVKHFAKNKNFKENIMNMVNKYEILNKLIEFQKIHKWDGILIQGECFGPSIQGNKMGAKEVQLNIFNLIQIRLNQPTNVHYSLNSLEEFSIKYNIPMVKVLHTMIWNRANSVLANSLDDLRKYVKPLKYENGAMAEGIVIREYVKGPYLEDAMTWNMCHAFSNEISFKCVHPDFLIKYDT